MISCPFCTKFFKNPSKLNEHVPSHTKEKPYKCNICSAAFGVSSEVTRHIKTVHHGRKPIRHKNSHCSLCSYTCFSKTMLGVHLRTHSAEQPFSCSIPSCGFKTKYKNYLKRHVRGVHNNERPYDCPSDGCNFKAKSSTNLRYHLKTHSNEKPYACQVPGCTYTCKIKTYLKDHTFRAHSDEKTFKCSTCDFRTKVRSSLFGHQLTHRRIKRFQCQAPNCGYASHVKLSVEHHFDSKHRQKDVWCTVPGCSFKCRTITALKSHLKQHDSPLFKCLGDSCNYSAKHRSTLRWHISRRHEGAQSAALLMPRASDQETPGKTRTMKNLKCRYPNCGYQTTFPHRYDRHRITHNEEEHRKHVCTFCFLRFTQLRQLQDHLKRHTGEKPYRCSCRKYTAATSMELRVHARRVHQIYLIHRGKEDEMKKCCTCSMNLWSSGELVLHSMSHLQPVVVLEQLKLRIM